MTDFLESGLQLMMRRIYLAVVVSIFLFTGCKAFRPQAESMQGGKLSDSAWETSTYQRDHSLLGTGLEPQAREIERRLGVK